ncbi:hypothetical protein [Paenibacillus tyrfis]|uniref:hypothetical protein n=1 Tax=Paenibacillus tyrfis TaxID=1501230 RepID=UPI00209E3F5A|nr:hypothetical protein [Paenibacillus tyrfis]MCP1312084.1 hypothetical protein [Paenibacillus tyrfis]
MSLSQPFFLDEYIEQQHRQSTKQQDRIVKATNTQFERFQKICESVKMYFNAEWEDSEGKGQESSDKLLERHKKAIIGYSSEVNFFKGKIEEYLKKNNLIHEWKPKWYPDITTAIFQEVWGVAGIYEWKNMPGSSSAKIIGERIYFLMNGRPELREQTISRDRLNQLISALLLRTPEKRRDEDYHEVYMLDGTRIMIYEDSLAKETSVVFRKYVVDVYTFEKQAELGTIPAGIIPMLEAQVRVGYNVAFVGPVRSAKTTFLTTWQSYEDPALEGIQIETDPEIPLHVIMPKAPIIQMIADGDRLSKIIKPLMRSDGDYLITAEARDGIALKISLDVTKKGTRRVKMTYHTSDPIDFCYDVATEIVQQFGGDIWATTIKMAKGYHYLFEFTQLKDKSQKRLKGIFEIRYNPNTLEISIHQICRYDFLKDDWTFKYDIGADKEAIAQQEDYEAFQVFQKELKKLAEQKPMNGQSVFQLPYMKFIKG